MHQIIASNAKVRGGKAGLTFLFSRLLKIYTHFSSKNWQCHELYSIKLSMLRGTITLPVRKKSQIDS